MCRMLSKEQYEGNDPPKKIEMAQNGGSKPPTPVKPGELAGFIYFLQRACRLRAQFRLGVQSRVGKWHKWR